MGEKHLKDYSSLFTLLNNEELVISDNIGETSRENDGWYENKVYQSRHFHDIDTSLLERVLNERTQLVAWWSDQKVITTENVALESENFLKTLTDKLTVLNQHYKAKMTHKWNKKNKKWQDRISQTSKKNRFYFQEIIECQRKIARKTNRSVYPYKSLASFAVLEDIIRAVAIHTTAKIDFSGKRYHGCSRKGKEEIHTDEQIVATAFYLSIIENQPITVVTFDSDLQRLFKNTHYALLNLNNCPQNFLKSLKEHEIINYFFAGKSFRKTFDSINMSKGRIRMHPNAVKQCRDQQLKKVIEEKLTVLANIRKE